MNYFQYKVKEPMGKIWALFQRLGKLSEEEIKGTRCEYLHTMEIIRSALAGNILLTDDAIRGFNLLAYENACKVNDKNNVRGNVSKELALATYQSESCNACQMSLMMLLTVEPLNKTLSGYWVCEMST